MATVLLIDDHPQELLDKTRRLELGHHTVTPVQGDTVGELYDKSRAIIGEQKDKFDFLVLDMQIRQNMFGGINLYNKLVSGGQGGGWRHCILFTKHVSADIAQATFGDETYPDEFVIRVFVETAGIPYENVLSSSINASAILDTMEQLMLMPSDDRCRYCRQVLNWR